MKEKYSKQLARMTGCGISLFQRWTRRLYSKCIYSSRQRRERQGPASDCMDKSRICIRHISKTSNSLPNYAASMACLRTTASRVPREMLFHQFSRLALHVMCNKLMWELLILISNIFWRKKIILEREFFPMYILTWWRKWQPYLRLSGVSFGLPADVMCNVLITWQICVKTMFYD